MSRISAAVFSNDALHHDQPGHFEHRIDVGFLEEALRDADVDAVDDRLRLRRRGMMPELPKRTKFGPGSKLNRPIDADQLAVLAHDAVGARTAGAPLRGSSWIGAPPASSTA